MCVCVILVRAPRSRFDDGGGGDGWRKVTPTHPFLVRFCAATAPIGSAENEGERINHQGKVSRVQNKGIEVLTACPAMTITRR